MSQIVANASGDVIAEHADGALERRIFRVMVICVFVAVTVSTFVAPWRVTAGLTLGGALSLLNYHWLRTSIGAMLSVATIEKPRMKTSRYILRYLLIGSVVFAGYKANVISLPATVAGLCSFVPALFVEASRQFYFAIIRREESF